MRFRLICKMLFVIGCIGWLGCGGQKTADQDRVIHESLQLLREFSALAATIKDESSARQAAGRFQELNQRRQQTQSAFARLRQRFSIADEARLNKKFGGDLNAEATRIKFELNRLADLPGVASTLGIRVSSSVVAADARSQAGVPAMRKTPHDAASAVASVPPPPANQPGRVVTGKASVNNGSQLPPDYEQDYVLSNGTEHQLPTELGLYLKAACDVNAKRTGRSQDYYFFVIKAASGEAYESSEPVFKSLAANRDFTIPLSCRVMIQKNVKGPFMCFLERAHYRPGVMPRTLPRIVASNVITLAHENAPRPRNIIEEMQLRHERMMGEFASSNTSIHSMRMRMRMTVTDFFDQMVFQHGRDRTLIVEMLNFPEKDLGLEEHLKGLLGAESVFSETVANGTRRLCAAPIVEELLSIANRFNMVRILAVDRDERIIRVAYDATQWPSASIAAGGKSEFTSAEALLSALLSDDVSRARRAMDQLMLKGGFEEKDEEIMDALVRVARVREDKTKEKVYQTLAICYKEKGVSRLLELLDDRYNLAKRVLYQELAKFPTDEVAKGLTKSLARGEFGAKDGLILIGEIAEPHVLRLVDNPNFIIQKNACDVLAEIGTETSLPALNRLATGGKNNFILDSVRSAIRSIRARLAADRDLKKDE